MLVFAIFYCVVPLAWLWFSPLALLPSIFVLGALMAFLLVVQLVMAWCCAARYDKRA